MSSIDGVGRRISAMPLADTVTTQALQPLWPSAVASVDTHHDRQASATTTSAVRRPIVPPLPSWKAIDGGFFSRLMAQKRPLSRNTSTHGDRGSIEADDFQVSVPVLANQESGGRNQSGSSGGSEQTFVHIPTHAGAANDFQRSVKGPSMKLHAVLDQQIEAAQIRLDAIAPVVSQQHLIDAVDGTCIELTERARQLICEGYPAADVSRLLAGEMSRLYERYLLELPTDLSQIVDMLKQRALTFDDVRGIDQGAPASAHSFNVSIPMMLLDVRSGRHRRRAGLAS